MLRPLGDRVIIEVAKEEKTGRNRACISSKKNHKRVPLLQSAKDHARKREKAPVAVNVGEQVMFEKYAGTEVKYEGTEYLIVAVKISLQ